MAFRTKDLQPAAIAAGAIVVGGLLFLGHKKRKRCRQLPGIWEEDGPLHLTPEAQDEAHELAKYKIREYLLSSGNAPTDIEEVVSYVANNMRDCAWDDRETEHQKQVWHGIQLIVEELWEEAQDREAFLSKHF